MSTTDQAEAVALEASRRIVAAVDALPAHIGDAVSWRLLKDDTETLASIGRGLMDEGPERAETMARLLLADVFIGDLEAVAPKLNDSAEPWATIRTALEEIAAAWRAAHPNFRTRLDREKPDRKRTRS